MSERMTCPDGWHPVAQCLTVSATTSDNDVPDPTPGPLAGSGAAHPPNECGDPSSCPQHAGDWWSHSAGAPWVWCPECGCAVPVVDETALDCGHSIARPLKGRAS